ncbi:nucleotide-binding alpha-beta plait domain-containing protein [Tanacetum coccineum]
MGKAKNFHVLQNAWIILKNNGLVDCNIKYCGGLSFLFEWNSREVALESLEANKLWLQQWFDDIKPWEEDDNDIGRLTWLNIEGLPSFGRNLGAIKFMLNEFGRVLEIGRLDFDSKLLLPIKALVLLRNMNDIGQPLLVTLNGKSYPIRIYEERFNVTTLITPSSSSDDGSSFEEEFVGPSMDLGGGDADFSRENLSESFKEDNRHGANIDGSYSHPNSCSQKDYRGSHARNNNSLASSGLLPPPALDSFMAYYSQGLECVKPTPNLDVSGPNEVEENANSLPDLGVSINKEIHGDQEDKELEDLFCSFQRLSEGANFDKQNKGDMKKLKHKKKKLVVGGCSSHMGAMYQMTNDVPSNDDAATKFIGEQLGFFFKKDTSNLASQGASGGILTMWDSRVFTMEQCFKDQNYLGVIGSWVGVTNKIGLLIIYAPQPGPLKESLWLSLESLMNSTNVTWVVFGDFNVVRMRDERSGCRFDDGEAGTFNDFISQTGLFDFPLCGRRFTRFEKDAQNNAKEVLKSNLLEWDAKAKNGLLNNNDILKREEWMMDLNHLEQLHHDDLKQKGRVRWAVEGDENTRFFHSFFSNKFANFTMKGIHVNGVWVESPNEVKKAALEHFSSRFKEIAISRPSFNNNLFRNLSSLEADLLESNISLEEVKNAI